RAREPHGARERRHEAAGAERRQAAQEVAPRDGSPERVGAEEVVGGAVVGSSHGCLAARGGIHRGAERRPHRIGPSANGVAVAQAKRTSRTSDASASRNPAISGQLSFSPKPTTPTVVSSRII